MDDSQKRLKYRLIESSSEDPDYPLFELIRGAESSGWMSVRFCTYPQEILIQFLTPVHLKQIQLLSNEKKIASLIEIHCYYPSNSDEMFSNYKQATFEKLGYIRMDTNSKTNYKAREFRKVYVDTYCLYLKLVLQKNYLNKFNVFNQIGLISIDFYGTPIAIKNNELYLKESIKDRNLEVNEDDMDEIAQEKLKILKNQQDEALKIEDYDEAKRIKKIIDKVKLIGKKIFEMEANKKIYVNNEDFDNAKIMKLELERLRSNLKYMNRQLTTILPYQNSTIELNRSISNEETKENKEIENINIDETVNKEKSFINEKQEKEQKDKEL
jgi:centrosomal protein CEP104